MAAYICLYRDRGFDDVLVIGGGDVVWEVSLIFRLLLLFFKFGSLNCLHDDVVGGVTNLTGTCCVPTPASRRTATLLLLVSLAYVLYVRYHPL